MQSLKLSNKKNISKKIIGIVFLQLIICYGIAQNGSWFKYVSDKYKVSIEMDKDEFAVDEDIYIRFKIGFQEDSIHEPNFNGFQIIKRNTTISTSMNNGEMVRTKTLLYVLKPFAAMRSSALIEEYIIESPTFFVNGEEIKVWKKITVLVTEHTKNEESNVKIRAFAENPTMPDGTYRYVISDDFGYIEICEKLKWVFYRKLTDKEFKLIKGIK